MSTTSEPICPKCNLALCTCGWLYQNWTRQKLSEHIQMLDKVLHKMNGIPLNVGVSKNRLVKPDYSSMKIGPIVELDEEGNPVPDQKPDCVQLLPSEQIMKRALIERCRGNLQGSLQIMREEYPPAKAKELANNARIQIQRT